MEEVHVVGVCNHKTRHDGSVLLPNCCELRRGSKLLAKTEDVHDVADPRMRSAESQEVKRLASEYVKSKKLSESASRTCWLPYQLTSAGFGQRSVDFWGYDLLLYFKVSEGEQESWPMKISFRVIPGAPYAHRTSMDHGTECTLCVDLMIYCLIAFRLRHTWTYLDLLYSFETWLLEPVLV